MCGHNGSRLAPGHNAWQSGEESVCVCVPYTRSPPNPPHPAARAQLEASSPALVAAQLLASSSGL